MLNSFKQMILINNTQIPLLVSLNDTNLFQLKLLKQGESLKFKPTKQFFTISAKATYSSNPSVFNSKLITENEIQSIFSPFKLPWQTMTYNQRVTHLSLQKVQFQYQDYLLLKITGGPDVNRMIGLGNQAYIGSPLVVSYKHQLPKGLVNDSWIVALKACNGKYVCAENNGQDPLIARSNVIDTWEKFELTKINQNNSVSLLSFTNHRFVSANKNGKKPLIACRPKDIDLWEIFECIQIGQKVAFRAKSNSKFVTAEKAGNKSLANRADIPSDWQLFEIVYLS